MASSRTSVDRRADSGSLAIVSRYLTGGFLLGDLGTREVTNDARRLMTALDPVVIAFVVAARVP